MRVPYRNGRGAEKSWRRPKRSRLDHLSRITHPQLLIHKQQAVFAGSGTVQKCMKAESQNSAL